MVKQKPINVQILFKGLQARMSQDLKNARRSVTHPSTQGDVVEAGWISLLFQYLPDRYKTRKAFVLDAWGRISEQIDLVIFDHQYSPFLLNHQGACYVPAESVYAVMEIKPHLTRGAMVYAGKKISSVRKLLRTSAPIAHAGGVYEPRRPFDILGGILTEHSGWKYPLGSNFESTISAAVPVERIDVGCVLSSGAFCAHYQDTSVRVVTSQRPNALVFFILKLLELLQALGTVPAMDIAEYARSLPTRQKTLTLPKTARSRSRVR